MGTYKATFDHLIPGTLSLLTVLYAGHSQRKRVLLQAFFLIYVYRTELQSVIGLQCRSRGWAFALRFAEIY